ncbi:MAG: hypothetical protein KF760_30345 [Candidatus Eremiobacteraeota bacterium]|nr:hypothetical protein [Candidatus Eremiobacteraeota bacterium]MCW5868119.1 hypothetical protein [Candidatus Eremiobacteraeota bacterium]
MRRNRGECLLVSCAAVGCLLVVAAAAILALWYFLRPRPAEVRPMVHQTPARRVEIQSGGAQVNVAVTGTPQPMATATPVAEETPLPQDFSASISADGYMLGMSKGAVQPSKRLIFKGTSLVQVLEARTLQVDEREWKAGDKVELAQLRAALPTRRESQKTERDGSTRHSFPLASGVEVQVWLHNGRAQKFALVSR